MLYGRILIHVVEYVVYFAKKFDSYRVLINVSTDKNIRFPNGTWGGRNRYVNTSLTDILFVNTGLMDKSEAPGDYCYPYAMTSFSFVIGKL